MVIGYWNIHICISGDICMRFFQAPLNFSGKEDAAAAAAAEEEDSDNEDQPLVIKE